jgi:hypothetical protein
MAKSRSDQLFDRLRKSGLSKSTARTISRSTDGRRNPAKAVRGVMKDLRGVVDDLEDRAKGGPNKRSLAAKKGAATRKRKAAERSASAKKGARTRAKAKK